MTVSEPDGKLVLYYETLSCYDYLPRQRILLPRTLVFRGKSLPSCHPDFYCSYDSHSSANNSKFANFLTLRNSAHVIVASNQSKHSSICTHKTVLKPKPELSA